ncbi:MAG TPA: type I glyceraldehyde-3-phosphate dehydrogenase [Dehalococcoidia bacterium]|nr:type I glyceraldehyde-3-phosphate dehydrogenase [Dehalococcoidia bacterium]
MAVKVGINGFGRIGRQVLRTIRERHPGELQVVAINDLVDTETNAHLLKYDTNYGRFPGEVRAVDGGLQIDNDFIRVYAERDPAKIPWAEAGVEIVIESTGFFTDATQAVAHKHDSVKKVIISAPAKNEDVTIVLGVNDEKYDPGKHHVISNASCTTNGLAPPVKVLVEEFGLAKGQMTTVHSYTNSQMILDRAGPKDLREARAGAVNIVPTSTGAARALRLVIPEVDGILDGLAYRVPTPTVSVVEVVGLVKRPTNRDEVNAALRHWSKERMKGILDITEDPVVSMDMKGNEHSSIIDGLSTNVVAGDLVKVVSWYDNEWGYACRLADLTALVARKGW